MVRSATVLERALVRGQRGVLASEVVLWVLAAGSVVIVSDDEPVEGEFPQTPLIVQSDDVRFLAVFTHEDQAAGFLAGRSAIAVPAFELLRRVPPAVGLVVNPGQVMGMEVPPDGLRAFTLTLLDPASI